MRQAGQRPIRGHRPSGKTRELPTAVVYCEANFGSLDGKTANGLVRHSERYEVVSVIDSERAGLDAGMVLDCVSNGIPICRDLADSLGQSERVPDYLIYGMAPASGMLSPQERDLVFEAMDRGMNVVSGLHEFLSDDPAFVAASAANNVRIVDVRKPPATKELRTFSGRIAEGRLSTNCRARHRLRDREAHDCHGADPSPQRQRHQGRDGWVPGKPA